MLECSSFLLSFRYRCVPFYAFAPTTISAFTETSSPLVIICHKSVLSPSNSFYPRQFCSDTQYQQHSTSLISMPNLSIVRFYLFHCDLCFVFNKTIPCVFFSIFRSCLVVVVAAAGWYFWFWLSPMLNIPTESLAAYVTKLKWKPKAIRDRKLEWSQQW